MPETRSRPTETGVCALKKMTFVLAAAMIAAAPNAAFAVDASAKGKMLYAADGARLAVVMRVTADGSAQIIYEGKVVTVPAASLADANGRLETKLTKAQLVK